MKIITKTTNLKLTKQLESTWPEGKVLLFDIETTGLKKETTYVYLIGCAYLEDGNFKIRQYLASSASDEREIIFEFLKFAKNYSYLVHFNGDRFDIPYLNYKADYYRFEKTLCNLSSFDIYRNSKVLKDLLGLERMNQKSIEIFLNIHRDDKFGGGELIPVYYEYEKTLDPKLEEILLLHNYDDIEGMFKIMPILYYLEILNGNFVFDSSKVCQNTLILNFTLPYKLVRGFEKHFEGGVNFFAKDNLFQVNIDIFDGEVYLPIHDIENYYYLPQEDRVIHKSVAQFVDNKYKKKATKKNCYLKKYGKFLPQKSIIFEPAYTLPCAKKITYFEYNDEFTNNKEILAQYVLDFIK